jgi:hypothetical protein
MKAEEAARQAAAEAEEAKRREKEEALKEKMRRRLERCGVVLRAKVLLLRFSSWLPSL